jgi:putative transposase
MVEEMLAARGIVVSHQTIWLWVEKFGCTFTSRIRQHSYGLLRNKRHLDEAVISIRGEQHSLWRVFDQDGFVIEVLVQSRRNAKAAKRLMRKLLMGQGRAPCAMVPTSCDPMAPPNERSCPAWIIDPTKASTIGRRIPTSPFGDES